LKTSYLNRYTVKVTPTTLIYNYQTDRIGYYHYPYKVKNPILKRRRIERKYSFYVIIKQRLRCINDLGAEDYVS
jgi:hypothetical protein